MRRLVSTVVLLVAVWAAFFLARSLCHAGEPGQSDAAQLVEEALRFELEGDAARRDALLRIALQGDPECRPARWHSGHVEHHGRWVKFDQLARMAAGDEDYQQYLRVRSDYPNTVEGQFELARWCEKHRLEDQARAHFLRVLQFDPDHRLARTALGFRNIGGFWATREQIRQMSERGREFREDLRKWGPQIERLRRQLASHRQERREGAKQQLLAIDEPEAVWAAVAVLGDSSEDEGLLLLEILHGIEDQEGSLALAHQAVFSQWEIVRRAAAEKLKARPMEEFVPAMLEAMQGPAEVRDQTTYFTFDRFTRTILERHIITREGWLTKEEAVEDSVIAAPWINPALGPWTPGLREWKWESDWNRTLRLARGNARTHWLNQRIAAALNFASDQQLPPFPESCWAWWNDYCDQYVGDKSVRRSYSREFVYIVSCFAAGTPVWTIDGLRPVEQLQVGDRVLSQDPDSGELAYKPVIRTTRREPEPLVTVRIGNEPFTCTEGHPFWACGQGWVQARHLKSGEVVHCVDGTAAAKAARPGPTEETFNLVVADFNTYFVGRQRILVHDVTPRQPTDVVVPGLR